MYREVIQYWWLLIVVACVPASGRGENHWPQFRGPSGDGMANADLVTEWGDNQNVAWKTPIHGRGWCSPVIWDDQIWLTTATEDGTEMFAVCVDANTGEVTQDRKLFHNDNPRFCHAMNSYASPSPVIESGRVYVHFGSYGTACLDTATGETIWQRTDLPCDHYRGPGSSPILYDGMLILHYDGFDQQYVAALDSATGQTIWRQTRAIDYGTDNGDLMKAYSTPIVVQVDGRPQLISPAAKATIAYDPHDGSELWRVRYEQHSATARPLFDGKQFFLNTGFPNAQLWAVRAGGRGDVTETHVRWQVRRRVPSMPSQLLIEGLVYMVHAGVATCLDAETGKTVWQERIGGKYSASPIHAKGKIYFFSHEGLSTVVRAGRTFELLAQNEMGDGFMASPAVTGDALILRSRSHLYRIQRP